MILHDRQGAIPTHWLAFELSVLRRLKFRSVAIPFVGEPDLPIYLKHWGARVAANDPARWAFIKSVAMVENNTERLTEPEVESPRAAKRPGSPRRSTIPDASERSVARHDLHLSAPPPARR